MCGQGLETGGSHEEVCLYATYQGVQMLLNPVAAALFALFSSHLDVPLPYIQYCTPTVVMPASAASSVIPGWWETIFLSFSTAS